LQREIYRPEAAEHFYIDVGVQIFEPARKSFRAAAAAQKRRLLNFVLSNCSWKDGEARGTFRQPFDLLAETTAMAARQEAENTGNSAKSEIWLGN
jgi:site-specific DNA recombinase